MKSREQSAPLLFGCSRHTSSQDQGGYFGPVFITILSPLPLLNETMSFLKWVYVMLAFWVDLRRFIEPLWLFVGGHKLTLYLLS